jgi:20S proteasome subunit beta 4
LEYPNSPLLSSYSSLLALAHFVTSNHYPLLPASASAWIRRTLAESIRSRNPYAVNLLLAGYDTTTSTPHLYWLDYLGTKAVVPYAAHGMGQVVCLGTMDKWWYEGIGREDGVALLKRCINEVETRELQAFFIVSYSIKVVLTCAGLVVAFNFNCILIDKDGIHELNLKSNDPIAELQSAPEKAEVVVPNPPSDVGVTA